MLSAETDRFNLPNRFFLFAETAESCTALTGDTSRDS